MKKLFLGVYNPSIILTYVGVFCAAIGMGILFAADRLGSTDALKVAMILCVVAGVCDLFDGRVARLCKRTEQEKQFGIQLDSLADVLSFVAFPVCMLIFAAGMNPISIAIACFYIFAGIMRLGWFNVTTEENIGCYRGLPVTYAAVIFPIGYVILRLTDLPCAGVIFEALYLIVGLLFILNFKMKKPKLIGSLLFALLAVATVIALILL